MVENDNNSAKTFDVIIDAEPSKKDKQIEELQSHLEAERDGRKEDRFVGIVGLVLLLDVVFFPVMPTLSGPLCLLALELLVLTPLANRMGMEEIAEMLSRVIHRMAGRSNGSD